MTIGLRLRPAVPTDAEALRCIERLAGEAFRTIGMDWVADGEVPSVDTLVGYAAAGRSWVAVTLDETGTATTVGYVLVDVVDNSAHVEQISVLPRHQGHGIGRALLEHVAAWARRSQLMAVTLTTFADVAWNRPLYEHLGYRVLADYELGPGLAARRAEESQRGLEPLTRVCMRRELNGGDGPPSGGAESG